jgi:hypothetical protein
MELEIIMLSEVSQTRKDKCHMFSYVQAKDVESRMVTPRGWEGEKEECQYVKRQTIQVASSGVL